MASNFTRTAIARNVPLIVGAMVVGIAGIRYIAADRPPLLANKALLLTNFAPPRQEEATKTLTFPRNMLFARQLTVSEVEQVNHDTKKITLRLPGGKSEVSGIPGGSAILTQHTPAGGFFPVLRPYTPIHDCGERGLIQLLVKHYPNGKASTYMHSLRPGQNLTVRGPLPGYSWVPSTKDRDVLFIAGGAGITPIYSLTKSILTNANDKARIQLVWGVNGTRDIVLRQELESLEKQFPDRLRVTYCVSGPESLGENDTDGKYRKGYVDRRVLQEAVGRFSSGSWGDEKGTKVFLCGPPAMEDAVAGRQGVLSELGVTKKNVHRF